MTARARRIALVCAVVAAAQGLAVWAYVATERRREDDARARVAPSTPTWEPSPARRPAPDLVLRRDGREERLSARRGRPVLLHFWATWCAPCRVELPEILALGREGAVDVLAASVDENDEVLAHSFDGAVPREVARVDRAAARTAYGVETLPVTVLVDADGLVRGRFVGAQRWSSPETRAVVESALLR